MYQFIDSLNKLSSLIGDGNTTMDDMWPLSIRKKELNRGEWQLAHDSKDLLGYTTGTVDASLTVILPTDWIETYVFMIDNIVLGNNREIALADWYKYYTWSGNPPYYYFWPDAAGLLNINLIGATEGSLYKLYYFKKPTSELSVDTDLSLHQEEFRDSTAYYAASELLRQVGKNAQADEYRAIYEAGVVKADAWARKLYVNKNYASPDLGLNEPSSTDIQGVGYYWGSNY